jgi:hypothetical protein
MSIVSYLDGVPGHERMILGDIMSTYAFWFTAF